MADPLDDLLAECGRRRDPEVPLHVTLRDIWEERGESLGDVTADALAFTGWTAMRDARAYPEEVPLPEISKRIAAGETFDQAGPKLDAGTYVRLAFLGFLALAAERFLKANADN